MPVIDQRLIYTLIGKCGYEGLRHIGQRQCGGVLPHGAVTLGKAAWQIVGSIASQKEITAEKSSNVGTMHEDADPIMDNTQRRSVLT